MSEGLDWPVVLARFVLVTLGVGLFGQACFPLYAPFAERPRAPWALRLAAPLAAAAAGAAWILALAREAAGDPGLPDPEDVFALCAETGFGGALAVAVLLALALAALASRRERPAPKLAATLSGALLTSLAFVGHAAAARGTPGAVRIAVMAAHLLFAGIWLGGLAPLARALPHAGADTERLLRAFGKTAMAAVAALFTTGMIAAAAILATAGRPPGRMYITTFAVKLALALGLLAVASVNRWGLTPLSARKPQAAARAMLVTLGLEQLLALALLATVARLTQLDPGM